MVKQHRVEEIVRSAWERRLLVLTVERVAIGVAIVLAAFTLMLLAGTEMLNGYWLMASAATGAGLVAYQVRQRVVAHYRVAQLVDQRLHLADSLSTAWYLLSTPGRPGNAFSEFQLKAADATARTVDVRGAFPFTGKRLWWVAGGLAVLALSLFWVRYLVTDSLSLRASLIPLRLSEVFERTDKDSNETKRQRELARGIDQRGQKNTPKTDGRKDGKEPARLEPPALAAAEASQQGQNPSDPAQLRESKDAQGKEGQEKRAGAEGNAQQREGQKQGDKGDESAAAQKPAGEDANNPQSSNGLIDRMKDALSSLAAKMRPKSPEQENSNQRSAENKKGEQQGGSKEENDKSRQNAKQQASEQQQAADGQAEGQTQETSRSGQGKTADQFADKTKSDAHSGIGSQDGEKEVKEIDQLKAMGKLAEIIGKRSASATGDVMVENSSGKQHLQTEYSGRLTQHADLGGEINRDEIPLMYQQYVREYMSQVRRQAKQPKQ